MNVRKTLRHIALGAVLALIAGCGAGTGDTVVASGGLTGTGITQGTVTGFGSIHVNGVRYITDAATFERDGVTAAISEFEVGEIVSLRWTLDADGTTRNASLVFYDNEIKGVVTDAPDLVDNTIQILGQTVQVTGSTAFKGTGIGSLIDIDQGDYVELNAFQESYAANAAIPLRATSIEVITPAVSVPDPVDVELKGVVSAAGANRIEIGSISISWIAAPDGTPEIGDFVEVEGAYNAGSGEIEHATISDARRGIEIDASDEDEAELEGVVTSLTNQEEFEVNGQPVVTATDVSYEPAGLILAEGDRIEVEGTINAFGILVAESIEARDEGDIEIRGDIDSLDSSNQSIVIRILGSTVQVFADDLTQFDDESNADVQFFDFADLAPNDHLVIRAEQNAASSQIIATRIERQEPNPEVALQGIVETKTDPSTITILGTDIDIAGATVVSWLDASDTDIGSAAFYNAIDEGITIVKAEGNATGWTEMEIED